MPIDDTLSRVKYEPPYPAAAPRHVQEGYPHPSSRSVAESSRAPPPPSRRVSDHEVVLPSVEPETVDLVSPPRITREQHPVHGRSGVHSEHSDVRPFKRKHPVPQPSDKYLEQFGKRSRPSLHGQELYMDPTTRQGAMHPQGQDHQRMELRPRHKANPSQEMIDLTSSSRQPPFGAADNFISPGQSYALNVADTHAYMLEATRRSTVRNDYYDQSAGARPHGYMPEHHRMCQRRPPPAHEYVPLRR